MTKTQMLDTVLNPSSDWNDFRDQEQAHDLAIERLLAEL